jgi:uncharacterized lipoprotein YddW (UPF0748 family)/uncharacterized protein YraI
MRKIYSFITLFVAFVIFISPKVQATVIQEDTRAVWVSTVYNLDYPKTKNDVEGQKQEFIKMLDTLKQNGINAVVVQVRPKADALYQSQINPWSDVLTGVQGLYPGYDPMTFMIEETHKRGMEFHAWLNPYRVTTSGTDLNVLSSNHPARMNPDWTFTYNNAIYYNPAKEEVKAHIVATVTEIVTNYKVDAIHFDDYFYPSGYPLPAGETKDGPTANARRADVNDMIKKVSEAIKKTNPSVRFGVSPIGIWKNSKSDPTGSLTNGGESYYNVYADTRTWIKNEWIDYVVPQIYWEIGHALADYETLVKWWVNEVKGTNVTLYIGHGIYKDAVAKEIGVQLAMNQNYSQIKGSFYFSLRDLVNNRMNNRTQIAAFYGGVWQGGVVASDTPSTPATSTVGENGQTSVKGALAVGLTGEVTATTLNVRSGARVDREIVTKVALKDTVTVLDYLEGWYKVRLVDGKIGWASEAYIQIKPQTTTVSAQNPIVSTPVVTASNANPTASAKATQGVSTAITLNVRSGARIDRPVVTTIPQGTKVTILDTLGDWYKISTSNGQIVGWANKQYIQNITV